MIPGNGGFGRNGHHFPEGQEQNTTVVASEAKQSNSFADIRKDCFVALPVIGRAFARPVGSSQ
jgi:hypothetical protein